LSIFLTVEPLDVVSSATVLGFSVKGVDGIDALPTVVTTTVEGADLTFEARWSPADIGYRQLDSLFFISFIAEGASVRKWTRAGVPGGD
jgi:hypothetical protein